jgi:hypothetical protein
MTDKVEETAIVVADNVVEQKQIVPKRRSVLTLSEEQFGRIKLLAEMMATSQLEYNKMKTGDIFIKMMKGIEIGLEPVAAMDLIDIIQGKPTLKPQGMLALAWGSGLMQSLSITDDGKVCTVKIQREGSPIHIETFSAADAKAMRLDGKDNWKKQPAVMRKWRAVSAACRIIFPDIIQGMYIPEEIAPDSIVDDNGEIVEAQYRDMPGNKSGNDKQAKPESPLQNEAPRRVNGTGETKAWKDGTLERFIESISQRYPGIRPEEICELEQVENLTDLGSPIDAWYAVMRFAYSNNQQIRMTHMRYHIQQLPNKVDQRLEFTAFDAQGNSSPVIYAYGRSGAFKAKISQDVYDTYGFNRYGDEQSGIEKPTETTEWVPMEEPAVIQYETEITKGDNPEDQHTYYVCTQFIPEMLWQDQQVVM